MYNRKSADAPAVFITGIVDTKKAPFIVVITADSHCPLSTSTKLSCFLDDDW